jgi:hypothetical protein
MAMLHGEMLEIIAWSSIFFREAPISEWPKRQESANNFPAQTTFAFSNQAFEGQYRVK